MKLADNYSDRPGPEEGAVNNPNGIGGKSDKRIDNPYAHKDYQKSDEPKYGTRKVYLSERIARDRPPRPNRHARPQNRYNAPKSFHPSNPTPHASNRRLPPVFWRRRNVSARAGGCESYRFRFVMNCNS